MKTLRFLPLVGGLLLLTASCSHNNDDKTIVPNLAAITAINQSVAAGSWHITYFYDSDTNETAHFTGYNFTFGAANALTATNGTNTYNGTWSVTNSDGSNDDNPGSTVDFNLAFTSPDNFTDLTDDWDVVSYTSNRIELIDVSGGGGGTDHLVFEKN